MPALRSACGWLIMLQNPDDFALTPLPVEVRSHAWHEIAPVYMRT